MFFGAVLDEDFLVATIWCDNAEHGRSSHGVGQDLVHVGVGEKFQSHPAILLWKVWGPEAGGPDFFFDLLTSYSGLGLIFITDGRPLALGEEFTFARENLAIDNVCRTKANIIGETVKILKRRDGNRHAHILSKFSLVPRWRTL